MKTLLKYWWQLLIIAVVVLVIGFFVGRSTITNKPAKKVITQAQHDTEMNDLTNKLNTKFWNQLADSSEVIQDLHKKRSDDLKIKIKLESIIASDKVALARKDSSKNCNDALDAQEEIIFDMGLQAYNDSIQLHECNFQKTIKDSTIAEKEKAFQNQLVITKNLTKELDNLSGPKTITPFINASWNSFGYVGAGGGVYYHNIGLGAKYMLDLNPSASLVPLGRRHSGFEINLNVKF